MKALLIAPRFLWPVHTGERLRATIWLSALADAEVCVVAPPGEVPESAPPFRFFPARASVFRAVSGAVAVIRERLPLQCVLSAPYDWRGAVETAYREAGPFDVTIVILARLHPWLTGALQGATVLDAVDSLRRNTVERGRAASLASRWLWRREATLMERLEKRASAAHGRVLVISEEETGDFGEAEAVSNGIVPRPLHESPRTFDFGFWGRLPYFANADAARWLLEEIWPAIRALHPSATLVIGGAEAPRALVERARSAGVTVVSPIEDVASFARDIRVALMPLRFGSGQSNKVLEAAEAGCALVGTPQALRGLEPMRTIARIENSATGIAAAAVELLVQHGTRARQAAALRHLVETRYARAITLRRFAAIARGRQ